MTEVFNPVIETGLGPGRITVENVRFWCRHTKELRSSQVKKATQFVEFRCLRYVGDFENSEFHKLRERFDGAKHIFICLPLNTLEEHDAYGVLFPKLCFDIDYNSSEYIIFKRKDGTFECNCQGWQTKARRGEMVIEGANCSHVLALYYCFKLGRFGKHKKGEV